MCLRMCLCSVQSMHCLIISQRSSRGRYTLAACSNNLKLRNAVLPFPSQSKRICTSSWETISQRFCFLCQKESVSTRFDSTLQSALLIKTAPEQKAFLFMSMLQIKWVLSERRSWRRWAYPAQNNNLEAAIVNSLNRVLDCVGWKFFHTTWSACFNCASALTIWMNLNDWRSSWSC